VAWQWALMGASFWAWLGARLLTNLTFFASLWSRKKTS